MSLSKLISTTHPHDSTTGMHHNMFTQTYYQYSTGEYIMDDFGNLKPMCTHLINQNLFSIDAEENLYA